MDFRGFCVIHGVWRAGYPLHIEGISYMGKLTEEEKGLLSMVPCERKNLNHGAEGVMFKILALLPYAVAVVLAVVVFAWGQT